MWNSTFLGFEREVPDARVSIIGAPYDLNSSRRYGSRHAPEHIRKASMDMEDNFMGIPFEGLPVEDIGDAAADNWNVFRESLSSMVERSVRKGSVPLVMGGDHSISPVVLEAIGRKDISVVSIDAHLDFDKELYGNPYSHATPRRIEAGLIGGDRVHIIGVRSWTMESRKDAEAMGVHIHDMERIMKKGMGSVMASLPDGPVYLTIDVDGMDPAHAPGTGTPEPFGLNPWDVLGIVRRLSNRIVGMDVVELCPAQDLNGITATLVSRLIAGFIASFFS